MQQSTKKTISNYFMILLGFVSMLLLGTVYSWGIFTYEVESYFGVENTQSGLPYMVSLVFYAFFMFLSGKYSDKYPPRYVMLLGTALVSIGWILSSFASNLWMLIITYGMIAGSGVGIAYGVPLKVVNQWFIKNRGLASGLVLVGFGLSPVITAPIAKLLVIEFGMMKTFLILGISFGIILSLLSLLMHYPKTHIRNGFSHHDAQHKSRDDMIKTPIFKGLYINLLLGTTIGLMMIGISSIIAVEYIELEFSKVALLLSLFAICNGLGRPFFGVITDKYSARHAIYLSYSLIILASLLMFFASPTQTSYYIISFSLFWFNLGGMLAIISTSTANHFGNRHFSQNYGLIFTAYGLGAITGVLTSGFFMDVLHNINYIFIMVITLSLIGITVTRKYIKKVFI